MSIDGKVTGDFLYREECNAATEEYYRLNRELPAQGFACGRVTMEGSFTGGWYPDLKEFEGAQIAREDYIADQEAARYAVAFDRRGSLGWKTSKIEDEDPGYGGAHIIEVLCEEVSDAYLAYLQSIGVSYIFAGKREMDLQLALEKLWSHFFMDELLLEGGSVINGAFLRAGLVDELSLVQVPMIAGADSKPLFEDSVICYFVVKETLQLEGGAKWLRFVKKNNRAMPTVKLSAVLEAIEMASDMGTYIYDLDEQKSIYLPEDAAFLDDEDREIYDLLDMEPERFIRLPERHDIHGYDIMEDFIEEMTDGKIQAELCRAVQGRGAFRRFKDKVRMCGMEQQWYAFQEKAHKEIAIEWCKENSIRYEID